MHSLRQPLILGTAQAFERSIYFILFGRHHSQTIERACIHQRSRFAMIFEVVEGQSLIDVDLNWQLLALKAIVSMVG